MYKICLWVIFITLVFIGYKAGWFDFIFDYFQETENFSRQEKVIENDDGSVTKVRYRNIVDIVTGR